MSQNWAAPYDNGADTAQRELTAGLIYDDVAYEPEELLTEKELFINQGKPKEHQNFVFPSNLDQAWVITHIVAVHNILNDAADATLAKHEQQRFEQDSLLVWDIQDKRYPAIPLALLLSYNTNILTTALSNTGKFNQMYQLGDPIKIPPAGTAGIKFVPARGITAAAAAATTPLLPGRGFANDQAFRVKFYFRGYLDRP